MLVECWLASRRNAVDSRQCLFSNRSRQRHVPEFGSEMLSVLERPLEELAESFGSLRVFVRLTQENPGERRNGISIGPAWIGHERPEVLRHIHGGECGGAALLRRLYVLAVFVLE